MKTDILEYKEADSKRFQIHYWIVILIAIMMNIILWISMSITYYRSLENAVLWKEIVVDLLGVAIETIIIMAVSIYVGRGVITLFWRSKRSFYQLFLQVSIIYLFIVLLCGLVAYVDRIIYPDYPNVFWKTFISDQLVLSIFVLLYFVSYLINRYNDEKESELERQLSVLSLRADNHFIFNSLNTLYGLIGKNQEAAEDFLESMADVFRYLTKHSTSQIVPLQEELAFTDAYINMLNYRYEGVSVTIDDTLRNLDCYVCPVSIQALVENAIRHNEHGRNGLKIRVWRNNERIIVENNLLPIEINTTKYGLQTLNERYVLITRRPITVNKTDTMFYVSLPIIFFEDLKNGHSISV